MPLHTGKATLNTQTMVPSLKEGCPKGGVFNMLTFPNAKINLGLQVTGKLPNGYHTISSCLFPIPWCDALEFIEAKKTSFQSSGIPIPGNQQDNLVLKAFKLLKKDYPLPHLSIHLHKTIPMGAGLGGGSADGAFMLTMLNQEFQLFLDDSLMEDYAVQLGSDCPFFIENKPVLVSGRGEVLQSTSLDLTGTYVVLINPNIHISTKEAYSGITPTVPTQLCSTILHQPKSKWKTLLKNDFEESIFPNHPKIEHIKQELYEAGAWYASMTGSGSTVFGLFETEIALTKWASFSHFAHWL